jgi:hypothetical protein
MHIGPKPRVCDSTIGFERIGSPNYYDRNISLMLLIYVVLFVESWHTDGFALIH